jgi:hypothetical protein
MGVTGVNNSAITSQTGNFNDSMILQSGSANVANVNQSIGMYGPK